MSAADPVAAAVLAYHQRSSHRWDRYAPGPDRVDWATMPDPYRRFTEVPDVMLPQDGGSVFARLGRLLRLAAGLSVIKRFQDLEWAVRMAPSSGNLHPTETYVLAQGLPDLASGLYHYRPREHGLERRSRAEAAGEARLYLGFTAIHWREAWKYGESAFRYSALDIGHALGALAYAAACVGWGCRMVPMTGAALAALLGVDRAPDFEGAEPEDPQILVQILLTPDQIPSFPALADQAWAGRANLLDPAPNAVWPILAEIEALTLRQITPMLIPRPARSAVPVLADLLLQRRSANQFDPAYVLDRAGFDAILNGALPAAALPFDIWDEPPSVHLVCLVERVTGLTPGLYLLLRDEAALPALQAALDPGFRWERVTPSLFYLGPRPASLTARVLNCRQAIASEGCFSVMLLAALAPIIATEAWRYRQLHWEAGLIGHTLYLGAEALGLRGTGIGCFFDDKAQQVLGLRNRDFASLYHFVIGRGMEDTRIEIRSAYPAGEKAG